MKLKLDHVAQKVVNEIHEESIVNYSEAMLSYRDYLLTNEATNLLQILVFDRFINEQTQKDIIESLILSNCPLNIYEEALGVPAKAVEWYKELFFDTSVFLTRLDIISYLEQYTDEKGRVIRERALDAGYNYILGIYAGVLPNLDSCKEYLAKMFFASTSKALNMNYSSSDSTTAKNAREYTKLMIQLFETVNKASVNNLDTTGMQTITITNEVPDYMQRHNKPKPGDIVEYA